MDIRLDGLVLSFVAAIALILCLGLAAIGVMLLGRGADAIEEQANETSGDEATCHFTGLSAQLTLYHAPINALSQQKAAVPGSETYPVVGQNRGYYLLELPENDTGWARSEDGTIDENCENVPIDETPLSGFATVCAFINTAEVVLFGEAELINATGAVPPGEHLIESVSGDRYLVVLDESQGGWVAAIDGQVVGEACNSLAIAPG
jgi:hypothetical protein